MLFLIMEIKKSLPLLQLLITYTLSGVCNMKTSHIYALIYVNS
jgi:hypothetical protein